MELISGFLDRVVDLPPWVQAMLAALAGAALAWTYYFGGEAGPVPAIWAVLIVMAAVIAAALTTWVWGTLVVSSSPVLGIRLMGLWAWLELVVGAVGVAAGIWIAATIVPTEANPSAVTKAVISGWGAGLSAAVTAGLAKRAEGADERVGERIRGAVQETFKTTFSDSTSDGWRVIYSDPIWKITGWGRSAREQRAECIAKVLGGGRCEHAEGDA